MTALNHKSQGGRVIARQQTEVRPQHRPQSQRPRHVAGCVFQPNELRIFGQAGDGGIGEAAHRA